MRFRLGFDGKMLNDDQINEYHRKVEDNVRKHGYHSTFVFSDNDPSFCYSTGICESFRIPELFISSLPQNLSHSLVEAYAAKFKTTDFIPLGNRLEDLTDRFPVYLMEVSKDKLKEYALSSVRFYGERNYKYLQLIYPDTNGQFPGEEGYDYDQIVLSEIPTVK